MSGKRGTFEHLVSSESAAEAIEIASESAPRGSDITYANAIDAAAECGADSWLVTIKFKRLKAEGDY